MTVLIKCPYNKLIMKTFQWSEPTLFLFAVGDISFSIYWLFHTTDCTLFSLTARKRGGPAPVWARGWATDQILESHHCQEHSSPAAGSGQLINDCYSILVWLLYNYFVHVLWLLYSLSFDVHFVYCSLSLTCHLLSMPVRNNKWLL